MYLVMTITGMELVLRMEVMVETSKRVGGGFDDVLTLNTHTLHTLAQHLSYCMPLESTIDSVIH